MHAIENFSRNSSMWTNIISNGTGIYVIVISYGGRGFVFSDQAGMAQNFRVSQTDNSVV